MKWTRLSCRRFQDNQARLQRFALAYNLANFLRQLALPRPVRSWSLTTLREKLEDRREGRASRQVGDVPAGGGGGAACAVRGDPGPARSAARGAEPRMNVFGFRQEMRSSLKGRGCSAVREGRGIDERMGGGGPSVRLGLRCAAGPDRRHFDLEREMRLVSNRVSARPGAVPVTEINSHLGNPG